MPYLYILRENGEIEEIEVHENWGKSSKELTKGEFECLRSIYLKKNKRIDYYGKDKNGKRVQYRAPICRDIYLNPDIKSMRVLLSDKNPKKAKEILMQRYMERMALKEQKIYDDYMKMMRQMVKMR